MRTARMIRIRVPLAVCVLLLGLVSSMVWALHPDDYESEPAELDLSHPNDEFGAADGLDGGDGTIEPFEPADEEDEERNRPRRRHWEDDYSDTRPTRAFESEEIDSRDWSDISNVRITSGWVQRNSLVDSHTSEYDLDEEQYVIARRGSTISWRFETDKPLRGGLIRITAQAIYPLHPPVREPLVLRASTFHINPGFNSYVVTTQIPIDAPIGDYKLSAVLLDSGEHAVGERFDMPQQLVVLFNAWHSADPVYLADDDLRSEYVLNTHGLVYRGSAQANAPQMWSYDQFHPTALQTALHLLRSFAGDRSDPIAVSRHFSFAVNTQQTNPNGLLIGRWEGSYAAGKEPTYWTNTREITTAYVQSGFHPVKYAQCWVYGAALNTMLRTVGIPSRQITTFQSAHESPDRSGKYTHQIRNYYNKNGKLITQTGTVWNFHSWNEAWIKRAVPLPTADLRMEPDGMHWHAVDATPQEPEDGMFAMGPAPLAAIKNRDESIPFDTSFVISEVDSRVTNFVADCSSPRCLHTAKEIGSEDYSAVGQPIVTSPVRRSTDRLHGSKPEEITWNYKQHRMAAGGGAAALPGAVRPLKKPHQLLQVSGFIEANPLSREDSTKVKVDCMLFGSRALGDVHVEVVITGYWSKQSGERVRIMSHSDPIFTQKVSVSLNSKTNYTATIVLPPFDPYASMNNEHVVIAQPNRSNQDMLWTMFATVKETKQSFGSSANLHLLMPAIEIALPEINAAVRNHSLQLTRKDLAKPEGLKLLVTWTNPFARPVTNGVLRLHASTNAGLQLMEENIPIENIAAHAAMGVERRISASEIDASDTRIVITSNLIADQLTATGFTTILLVPLH